MMGAIIMTKADWEEMWRVINCLDRHDIPEFSDEQWRKFVTDDGGRHFHLIRTDEPTSDLIWAAAMRRHQRSRAAMEDA